LESVTEPVSVGQGKSPIMVQNDSGGARFAENLTYVSSPGHSVFSVVSFLLLVAMAVMVVYYVYVRFRNWRRAQSLSAANPEVVGGAPGLPPIPAVQAVPQDQPPSYREAEMTYREYRDYIRREGNPVPSRNGRRRRREPVAEMDVCPHFYHEEENEEAQDMEAADIRLGQRSSGRVISYRRTRTPGSSQDSQLARPRLSDTEV
jgi:hypothetical protein